MILLFRVGFLSLKMLRVLDSKVVLFWLFLLLQDDRLLSIFSRLELNGFVTIGALEPIVQPVVAALFMEHMRALRHNFYLASMLEWFEADSAVLELLENLLLTKCSVNTVCSLSFGLLFYQVLI